MLPVLRYALHRRGEYLLGQLQPQMHDDGFANPSHQLNGTGRPSWRLPAVGMGNIRIEHDPEKWMPVFRKDHAPTKKLDHDPIQIDLIMV
jgi:hypothetical protein